MSLYISLFFYSHNGFILLTIAEFKIIVSIINQSATIIANPGRYTRNWEKCLYSLVTSHRVLIEMVTYFLQSNINWTGC